MHALVRFANVAAESQFSTRDLHSHVADSLGVTTDQYTLGSLRYDLLKLRTEGSNLAKTRTSRSLGSMPAGRALSGHGRKIGFVFCKR